MALCNCHKTLSRVAAKEEVPDEIFDAMSTTELEELCYEHYETEHGDATAVEYKRELVKRLLQKLPESERTVVTLYYLAEMTSEEISTFLGVSPNTVRVDSTAPEIDWRSRNTYSTTFQVSSNCHRP